MQLRLNGIKLNNEPKFIANKPTKHTHAITINNKHDGTPYLIPLSIRGIVSLFPTRKPTAKEYENADRIYALTQDEPEWDPTTNSYAMQEEAMMNSHGNIAQPRHNMRLCEIHLVMTPWSDDQTIDTHLGCAMSP